MLMSYGQGLLDFAAAPPVFQPQSTPVVLTAGGRQAAKLEVSLVEDPIAVG
jgi:hypothetical protein